MSVPGAQVEIPAPAPVPASGPAPGLIAVAIAKGPPKVLTYKAKGDRPPVGSRVRIPLGGRWTIGFVVDHPQVLPPEVTTLRTASEALDEVIPLSAEMVALARRVADYYMVPWGQVLAAAVPPAAGGRAVAPRRVRVAELAVPPAVAVARAAELARAPRQAEVLTRLANEGELPAARLPAGALSRLATLGLVRLGTRDERRVPLSGATAEAVAEVTLTASQQAALDAISGSLGGFVPLLLHGVTGSGKTEVYFRAAARVMDAGGQVLVLTPEIALASRLAFLARARFGERVALLHSSLSTGERNDEWRRVADGSAGLVIGTRSAVFAPLSRPGLIVVDEEHDGAYKQEESPRYHARDVALMRGREQGVPVLLGSATPSMESFQAAQGGRYRYLTLPDRVRERTLPTVSVVDLREERPVLPRGSITMPLADALRNTLERGEQAMLLLNRRGYSPLILCPSCGHTWQCPHCRVAFTFHREARALHCHYCDTRQAAPSACGECGDRLLVPVGVGTEGLLEELAELFPEARIGRMDRDTTRTKDAHLKILSEMESGRVDVLVGTQMIAKGHDLPGVTLVGVVCADQGIHVPDFRAAEGVFALLAQVAGRAGRGEKPGRVVLQTYSPEHPAVQHAVMHDYVAFAADELALRGLTGFPPAGRVVRLLLRDRSEKRLDAACAKLVGWLNVRPAGGAQVLGPGPAPMAVLRDEFRAHLLVKGERVGPVRQTVRWLLDRLEEDSLCRNLRVDVDVDPQTLM